MVASQHEIRQAVEPQVPNQIEIDSRGVQIQYTNLADI
jgi:hypothetical protein